MPTSVRSFNFRYLPTNGSQAKQTTVPIPPGVRLVKWNLNEPPMAIDVRSVVVNSSLFAHTTLTQLGIALAEPKRWVGWTVPQLIDRLAQIGVVVILDEESRLNEGTNKC